ncbi:MAG TPA: DUF4271 domain-containing protein [Chitinophagales bacterium]|nr:DUF4271 domain-containing protein [Chitinophagales bacterium]
MIRNISLTLFLFFIFVASVFSQGDTIPPLHYDSAALAQYVPLDSATTLQYTGYTTHQSFLVSGTQALVNNIQQYNPRHRNGFIFVLLMVLLGVLTYVKTAFSKQMEEMLQSIVNRNTAQQTFRTQSGEISFADILLNINFTIVISLYARFFLMKYFHVSSLDTFYSVLILIFLFTFFYAAKIISLQFIGNVFELQNACDEYIFNFTTVCKTLGLALLPALFVFYTASEKFFDFVFVITIFFFVLFAIVFVWRALSTVYKLMYRSVYHFFIYVCVVEISSVFLFIKLLTKTII